MHRYLIKERTATVDQGRERKRRFVIKRRGEYICILLEKRIDIRESSEEVEECLAHGFIALLHFLIGQICQLRLFFRSPAQLKASFGRNELPIEETVEERHL